MSGSYTLTPGETERIIPQSGAGSVYLARIDGADVRVHQSDEYAPDGVLLEEGDVANMAVPNGRPLYAYNSGTADATVELDLLQGNYDGGRLRIDLQPRRIVDVEGNVEADVSDRTGRNLGKARLMDSSETLIDGSNPLPTDVKTDGPEGGLSPLLSEDAFQVQAQSTNTAGSADAAEILGLNLGAETLFECQFSLNGAADVVIETRGPQLQNWTEYHRESYGGATTDVLLFDTPATGIRAYATANLDGLELMGRGT